MEPIFNLNKHIKNFSAPSYSKLETELDRFNSTFKRAEMIRLLHNQNHGYEYTNGLSELIDDIKNFRLRKGFDTTTDISAIDELKDFPTEDIELDKCKISLRIYHDKICADYWRESLMPTIVKNRSTYIEKFGAVCKKVLNQRSYSNLTYPEAGLFYAFTLIQILEKLGVNIFETVANIDSQNAGNFILKYKGSILDCRKSLAGNKFIEAGQDKKLFPQIFKKKSIIDKVNWIGTISELSRCTFLLHNDFGENHIAVCSGNRIYQKAANCFTINNIPVDPDDLLNNKRRIKPAREKMLLAAIANLCKK